MFHHIGFPQWLNAALELDYIIHLDSTQHNNSCIVFPNETSGKISLEMNWVSLKLRLMIQIYYSDSKHSIYSSLNSGVSKTVDWLKITLKGWIVYVHGITNTHDKQNYWGIWCKEQNFLQFLTLRMLMVTKVYSVVCIQQNPCGPYVWLSWHL